jgi:hypothetical protein
MTCASRERRNVFTFAIPYLTFWFWCRRFLILNLRRLPWRDGVVAVAPPEIRKSKIMKTIALIITVAAFCVAAFGQGTVILENAAGTGNVTINGALGQPGIYQVALLWWNGSTFVQEGSVYQTSLGNNDGPGYFSGETVTVPTFQTLGTFEVEGWTGNFANYSTAIVGGAIIGLTPSFVNNEGNPNSGPTPPVGLSGVAGSGWDGNLIIGAPEPSAITLSGLGAVVLWLYRRRR